MSLPLYQKQCFALHRMFCHIFICIFSRICLLHTTPHILRDGNVISLQLWQRSQSFLDIFGLFGTFKRLASLPRPSQVMLLDTLECGKSCSPVQGYCFPQVFLLKCQLEHTPADIWKDLATLTVSRIIQSASSRDGKPCRVVVWFRQRDICCLRPSKLPPQCCGVMTVIITGFVRRSKNDKCVH